MTYPLRRSRTRSDLPYLGRRFGRWRAEERYTCAILMTCSLLLAASSLWWIGLGGWAPTSSQGHCPTPQNRLLTAQATLDTLAELKYDLTALHEQRVDLLSLPDIAAGAGRNSSTFLYIGGHRRWIDIHVLMSQTPV